MAQAVVLTIGSIWISLSTLFLWDGKQHAPILLFLYVSVAAAFLAWLSLPFVEWQRDPSLMSLALAASP